MCEVCDKLQGKTVIDTPTLDKIIGMAITKAEPSTEPINQDNTLTFTPNESQGEGTASTEELDHRAALLALLALAYDNINEIINDATLSLTEKINEIDTELSIFEEDTRKQITNTLPAVYQNGQNTAKDEIIAGIAAAAIPENSKPTIPNPPPLQPRRDSIMAQQHHNIKAIRDEIGNKIKSHLYVEDVYSYYPNGNDAMSDSWLDNIFGNAENRLDMMGMFGYLECFRAGYLGMAIFAGAIIASPLKLNVYWITAHDSKVCIYCMINEANNPHSPYNIPYEHPWGRCGLKISVDII